MDALLTAWSIWGERRVLAPAAFCCAAAEWLKLVDSRRKADGRILGGENPWLSDRKGEGFRTLAYESLPCRNPRAEQDDLWGFKLWAGLVEWSGGVD